MIGPVVVHASRYPSPWPVARLPGRPLVKVLQLQAVLAVHDDGGPAQEFLNSSFPRPAGRMAAYICTVLYGPRPRRGGAKHAHVNTQLVAYSTGQASRFMPCSHAAMLWPDPAAAWLPGTYDTTNDLLRVEFAAALGLILIT